MANFPKTQPALNMTIKIGIPLLVGSVSRGTPLTVVPITAGTLRSEPGFPILLDASFKGVGNDYIHNDPTGKHMRLDAHGVIENSDGNLIYIKYYGVIDITPELSAILGGSPHSKTTDFGHSFIHVTFETGAEKYKELETGVYVGAGRFVIETERPGISVEYKISRVVKGPTGDETGADDVHESIPAGKSTAKE